ncbi:restriction endonuclease subunit S [Lederbergia ruris]|uniref:restriction endonuclease subunit S n=1 Tax=Lederbergia ruris TaxID=217495 RepID=UPI0039A2D022
MVSESRKQYKIGELYDSSSGLSKSRKEFGFGYPFLTFKEVFNNYFIPDSLEYLANTSEKERQRCSIKKGDIFITRTSETQDELGMTSVALKDYPNATFNGFTKRLRLKSSVNVQVNNKYIGYYLRSPKIRSQITSFSSLTTRASLNNSMLNMIEIELPHLDQQKAIATILSSLDEKIETNNEINEKLEELAQAIFKQWFIDFEFPNEEGKPYKSSGGKMIESELGMIPEGWEVGSATEQFSVQSGGTPKTNIAKYWDGDIPFFTPKDSHIESIFVLATEKNITQEGLSKCNSKLYETGTIFITARGTVGNIAMAGREMAMNQSCYALVANDGFAPTYIYFLVSHLVDKLKANASGSVFGAIIVSTFTNLKAVIPNKVLIKEYDSIVESLFSEILSNSKENRNLASIRDTLLPKLMSGEIRLPLEVGKTS